MQGESSNAVSSNKFDFSPESISLDETKSTLDQLMAELNEFHAVQNEDGLDIEIGINNLKGTLSFVGGFTGRTYKSRHEPLPLVLLKTIKLFYLQSRDGKFEVFDYVRPPHLGGRATMEFRLSGQAPRNERNIIAVQALIEALGAGISDARRKVIDRLLLTPSSSQLLEALQKEGFELLTPLGTMPVENQAAITTAIANVARQVEGHTIKQTQHHAQINEAIYTRLQILPFLHHANEQIELGMLAKLDMIPAAIDAELLAFSACLGQKNVDPYRTKYISLSDFPDFFSTHAKVLTKLTAKVTRMPDIQKRDLEGKMTQIKKLIFIDLHYLYHAKNLERKHGRKGTLEAKLVTVASALAALCAVGHQLKDRTLNYSSYWQGKSSKLANSKFNLLAQMEPDVPLEDMFDEDSIPEGVKQLMHDRFKQFHSAIRNDYERTTALNAFSLARLAKYEECLRGTHLESIESNVNQLNHVCWKAACHEASLGAGV